MLPAAGWSLQDVRSKCVSEVGATPSYWVSFANAYAPTVLYHCPRDSFLYTPRGAGFRYMPRVIQSGLLDQETVNAWWKAQTDAMSAGSFFAAANYCMSVTAHRLLWCLLTQKTGWWLTNLRCRYVFRSPCPVQRQGVQGVSDQLSS